MLGATAPDAIGVSCGGPLDGRRGLILGPPNLPGWDCVDVAGRFQQRFGAPTRLQNDANACAVAEWLWGAGQGTNTMIFLTFGTGMGAGLIIDGRLHSGLDDLAGEVGHIRLAEDGPEGFGKRGSFEGFCSGGGLARMAEAAGLGALHAHELFALAGEGNAAAQGIVQAAARQLGRGLAILVDMLNPDCIVIGSIFARQREVFWPIAEMTLREEALPAAVKRCKVVPAALAENVGDYAALALAMPS